MVPGKERWSVPLKNLDWVDGVGEEGFGNLFDKGS